MNIFVVDVLNVHENLWNFNFNHYLFLDCRVVDREKHRLVVTQIIKRPGTLLRCNVPIALNEGGWTLIDLFFRIFCE